MEHTKFGLYSEMKIIKRIIHKEKQMQEDGILNSRSRGYLRLLLGNKKIKLIRETVI